MEETKHGLFRDCVQGAPEWTRNLEKARCDCFVSRETGLEGGLHVSVSQVETKHLDFQGFSRVPFQSSPPKKVVLKGFR